MKKCSCGAMYPAQPPRATVHREPSGYFSGHYWNCTCGTTLFVRAPRSDPDGLMGDIARDRRQYEAGAVNDLQRSERGEM